MSGETWRPTNSSSSAVLTIAVTSAGGTTRTRPARKRAAPTPPASAAITRPTLLRGVGNAGRGELGCSDERAHALDERLDAVVHTALELLGRLCDGLGAVREQLARPVGLRGE